MTALGVILLHVRVVRVTLRGTVVREEFRAERVDHDGTQGSCDDDREDGRGKHLLRVGQVRLFQIVLRHFHDGDASERSLHGGLGDPAEGHEDAFSVVVFGLHSRDEGANPAEGDTDQNDEDCGSEHAGVDVLELDCSSH